MALNKLTKIQTLGIGSNIEVVGVITTGQFKSGTSNLHASGVELTNLNVSGIATIGGNVSIGGTLTYQDVTNIDSVGIITARSTIDAQGDVSIADKIIHTGDTNTAIRFPSADTITFETAGSERARIDSNGFVGIKETSPHLYYSPDLVVKAAAENGGITIRSAGTTHNNYLMFADGNSGDSRYDGYIKYNHNSRQFDFATAATTRLTITSNGKIGIGIASPTFAAGGGVHLKGGNEFTSYRVSAHTNTGVDFSQDATGIAYVYNRDNADLILGTNNAQRLRINSSGNVGINQSSPRTTLDVSGYVYLGAGGQLQITGSAGAKGLQLAGADDGTNIIGTMGSSGEHLAFRTASNERMRLLVGGPHLLLGGSASVNEITESSAHAGMVIGGTGFGNAGLAIISSTSGTGRLYFGDSVGGNAARNRGQINYYHNGDYMLFATAGSERLRITNTGQLLLGETSAFDSNTAIQFRKDSSGANSRFIFRNRANDGSSRVRLEMSTLNRAANGDIFSGMEQYQSGGMAIFNGQTDTSHCGIDIFTGNWRPLRLKNGNVSGNDAVHIQAYWGTSHGLQMEVGGPQSGTHKAIRFQTSHYGGERGYIGVTLGGTSYNSSSDYRMKQDVVDITGAIDRVKSFKPKRFKWKEDPTHTVDGFLAHEAATVVPESVTGEKDAVDENGDPKYQVIDQSKLVPVLTAALKEAIAKIETLETKVAALEGS